jgi:hypothetical protein
MNMEPTMTLLDKVKKFEETMKRVRLMRNV